MGITYKSTLTPSTPSLTRGKYTLDDLEQDEEFLEVSERFLESIGEKSDDVFEFLRDSDFNLYSGMQRAMQSGKFNEQQKKDYSYLRKKFDGADVGSLKQWVELIKDGSIDVVTDPTLLLAAVTTPLTGGTSLAARQGITTALNQGSKLVATNSLKDVGKKQALKTAGIISAEASAWTGFDNHFRQNTELNVGLRKQYSNPELVGSAALGALTGALFGGLAQRNLLFNSKMNRYYSDDEFRKEAGNELLFKARKLGDTLKARTIGSATSILDTISEFSPSAKKLGQTIREDFEKKFLQRTRKKLDFSYGEDLDFRRGNYFLDFDAALKPVRKAGTISPENEQGILKILRGDNPTNYNKEVQQTAKNLRKFFDNILKDAEDAGLSVGKVEDYFPRQWDRNAISKNPELFKQKLVDNKIVSSKEVDDVVEGMLNKNNELYAPHSILLTQARKFQNLKDNEFSEFLTNDLVEVATNYYMNAARMIEHKNSFLLAGKASKLRPTRIVGSEDEVLAFHRKSNEEQFTERFIDNIDKELKAVRGKGLTKRDKQKILNLYKSVTGQVEYFNSGAMQGAYDAMKLANSMAYLPLASVSSLTEGFLPLIKGNPTKSTQKVLEALKEGNKIFIQDIPGILRLKHKMSTSQIQKELNSVFIGMDEAISESTNRLSGEGLQNEFFKKIGRGFFRFNFLTPWTKTVELGSFNVGKDLILDNLTKLNNFKKQGINISSDTAPMRVQNLKGELFDLGIDVNKGISWLNKGANIEDNFYTNNVVRGAGRFVRTIILPTARERAKIPTLMTNPKIDILTQFLRYPTVFSNTVLKNFARDAIQNPAANAPRVTAFAIMATTLALQTNYWRSSKENRDKIDQDGFSNRDILKAFQRVGLLGPIEYGVRFGDALNVGKNPAIAASNLGGPIFGDFAGHLIYNRGLLETYGAGKIPGVATQNIIERYTGVNPYAPIKQGAKKIDKKISEGIANAFRALTLQEKEKNPFVSLVGRGKLRPQFFEGGEVNVPFVRDEPENRIDPFTGEPYAAQSDITNDSIKRESTAEQMERLGFSEGRNPNIINLQFLQKYHNKNFTDVDEFKGTLDKELKGQTVSMRLGTFGIDGKTYILPTYAKGIGKILPVETFMQDIRDGKIIGYKTKDEAEKQLSILRSTILNKERTGFANGGEYDSKNVIDDLSKQFMNPKEQRNFEADAAESLNKLVSEQRLPEEYKLNITGSRNKVRYVEGSNDAFNALKHYNLGIKYGDSVIGTTLINAREVGQILTQGRFLDSAQDIQNNIKGIAFLREAKGNKQEALMLALNDIEKRYKTNK
tara:strand:- start:63 stop:3995 length:3933 start_codon:yes stop_codon:yes gene_type:complete